MNSRNLLNTIEKTDIKWLELQFMDLLGYIHSVIVSVDNINEKVLDEGLGKLDGSSVPGFSEISMSDLSLIPIEDTFNVLPWELSGTKVGRVICGIGAAMGRGRCDVDPRYTVEKLEMKLREENLTAYVAAEVEFFIFDNIEVKVNGQEQLVKVASLESPERAQGYSYGYRGGYYIPPPLDTTLEIRSSISHILDTYFGIKVEAHHHEVAVNGQVEINIKYDTSLKMSDNLLTLKYVAKRVASEYDKYISFMPKPLPYDNGSGMHIHQNLWKGGENLFYDPSDDYAELSQLGRYYIGGLLDHGRGLSAIVAPTVNSYKRLIPGYESPVYLVWSRGNRSAAVRVPIYRKGDYQKRVEFRPPDPSANPYLALTATIAAGLDGIRKKIDPGDPVDKNVYHLSDRERRTLGIRELPRDLIEAIEELESDNEYLKPYFSSELIDTFVELKRREARRLLSYPSPIEYKEYFNI